MSWRIKNKSGCFRPDLYGVKTWHPPLPLWGPRPNSFFSTLAKRDISEGTTTFHGFNHILNGNATAIGMGAVSASLYAIGADPERLEDATHRAAGGLKPWPMPRSVQDGFEGRHNAAQAGPLPGFGLVCDEQLTDRVHTRKWKFSIRAQHRSVCCCHHHRATMYQNHRWDALRCYGLACAACRIFTAHAQCSFLVGCRGGWRAGVFDQPLHGAPAITRATINLGQSLVSAGYHGTRARGSA